MERVNMRDFLSDDDEFSLFGDEGFSVEDVSDEISTDEGFDPATGDPFTDRTGRTRTIEEDRRKEMIYRLANEDGDLDVFGMPLSYNFLDDPNGRAYSKTFKTDLPLVFMMPGKPKIHRRLFGDKAMGGLFDFGDGLNRVLEPLGHVMYPNKQNTRDGRLISIHPNYTEYYAYLQTMASQVHAMMGLEGGFVLSEFFGEASSYGLAYFGNKGTSISESATHEYNQTSVASEVNSKNQDLREKRTLIEVGGASMMAELKHNTAEFIKNTTANIPFFGGIIGNFIESLQGNQLYYPDLWSNSLFDRTYNLEFRFHSPYGDPESIFRHVYLPFLSLLVLSLPLQNGIFSYKQPFMVRVNSPGRFETEAGVIQSMNIVRGEEQTWTADGLPREITVSINVRDLYPNMMASRYVNRLKFNRGLLSYLDAMAGVRYDQLNLIDKGKLNWQMIKNQSDSIMAGNYFRNKYADQKYSYLSSRNLFGL